MVKKRRSSKTARSASSSDSEDDNVKHHPSTAVMPARAPDAPLFIEAIVKKEPVEPEVICLSDSSDEPYEWVSAKRLTANDLKAEYDSDASTIPEPMEVDEGTLDPKDANVDEPRPTSFSQVRIKFEPGAETESAPPLQSPPKPTNVVVKKEPLDARENRVVERHSPTPTPGPHSCKAAQNPPESVKQSEELSCSNSEVNAGPLPNVFIKKEPVDGGASASKLDELPETTSGAPVNEANQTFGPSDVRVKTEPADDRESPSRSALHRKASKRELQAKLDYMGRELRKRIKIQPPDDGASETMDVSVSSEELGCQDNVPTSQSENTSSKQSLTESEIGFSAMSIKEEFSASKQKPECAAAENRNFQNPVIRERFSTDILKYFSVVSELHASDVEAAAEALAKSNKKERSVLFRSSIAENRGPRPNRNRGILFESNTVVRSNMKSENGSQANFGFNSPARTGTDLPPQISGMDSAISKVPPNHVHNSDSGTVHLPEKPMPNHVFKVSERTAAVSSNVPSVTPPEVEENMNIASVASFAPSTEQLQKILAAFSSASAITERVQPNQSIPGSSVNLNSLVTPSQNAHMEIDSSTQRYQTLYQPPSTDRVVDISRTNFVSSPSVFPSVASSYSAQSSFQSLNTEQITVPNFGSVPVVSPMPSSSHSVQASFQSAHGGTNVIRDSNLQSNRVNNHIHSRPLQAFSDAYFPMPLSSHSIQSSFQSAHEEINGLRHNNLQFNNVTATDRSTLQQSLGNLPVASPVPPSSHSAQSFQNAHGKTSASKEGNLQFNSVHVNSNGNNIIPVVGSSSTVPSIPSSSTSMQSTFQAGTDIISRENYPQPVILDKNLNRKKQPNRVSAAAYFERKASEDPRCRKNGEPMDTSVSNERLKSVPQSSGSENTFSVPSRAPVQNMSHSQVSVNSFPSNPVTSRNERAVYPAVGRTNPASSRTSSFVVRDPRRLAAPPLFDRRRGEKGTLNLYKTVGKKNINDYFVVLVLQWNPRWLFIQEETNTCPPICDAYPCVKYSYSDETDYYNTYIPLHLLSVWLRIYDCWKKQKTKEFLCMFCRLENSPKREFLLFTCVAKMSADFPKRDDIVLCKNRTTQDMVFLRVYDVQIKTADLEGVPTERKLRITFESLTDFLVQSEDLMDICILFNISIATLQNEVLLSPNVSLKNLILDPSSSFREIGVVNLDRTKHLKSHRDVVLNALSPDGISVVLVNLPQSVTTPLPYDNTLLILYLVYQLKDKMKILICMKNEDSFMSLVKRLKQYKPVLVVRSKEIRSMEFEQYKEHTLEAGGSKEERRDLVKNRSIFVTTFSAFQANDRKLLAKEKLACIIDESDLCTEAETSVPLSLKVGKLILLAHENGKPELPTLLAERNYDMTLYYRLLTATWR